MNVIDFEKIEINQYFEKPVYLNKQGFLLLYPENIVNINLKNRLILWDFKELYTEGSPIPLEEVVESQQRKKEKLEESQEFSRISVVYKQFLEYILKIYKKFFNADAILNYEELLIQLRDLIAEIKNEKNTIRYKRVEDFHATLLNFELTEQYINDYDYFIIHALNTCILTVAMCDNLDWSRFKILDAAIAAFFHQVGMVLIPTNLKNKTEDLTPEDRLRLIKIPVIGAKILKEKFNLTKNIWEAVLHSKENMDGSGYPSQLDRVSINEAAQIIRVASSFAAQITPKSYKMVKTSYDAVLDILKKNGTHYNPDIVKTMMNTLHIFPIGATVFLKERSFGIITKIDIKDPKTPLVKIVVDFRLNAVDEPLFVKAVTNTNYAILRLATQEEISMIKSKI